MSHKKLRPCIVKVSVLGYFPLLRLVKIVHRIYILLSGTYILMFMIMLYVDYIVRYRVKLYF